jgi:hypothetical protein
MVTTLMCRVTFLADGTPACAQAVLAHARGVLAKRPAECDLPLLKLFLEPVLAYPLRYEQRRIHRHRVFTAGKLVHSIVKRTIKKLGVGRDRDAVAGKIGVPSRDLRLQLVELFHRPAVLFAHSVDEAEKCLSYVTRDRRRSLV